MGKNGKTKIALHWLAACSVTVLCLHLIGQNTSFRRFPGPSRRPNVSTRDEALPDHSTEAVYHDHRPPKSSSRPASTTGFRSLKKVPKPVMVVVVASVPRSGSTFLGELLASPREAVFFFEPFWYCDTHGFGITKDMHLSPKKSHHGLVQRYLLNMLNCSLASLPPMFDERLDLTIWRKPLLSHATIHQLQHVCLDLKLRLVKVVRPGLGSVLPLLHEPDLDMHVIHLVRDPRAIVNSILEKGHWIDQLSPLNVCDSLRNDLRVAREFNRSDLIEQRYTLVRYEDLVGSPELEARRLFHRMGLKLPRDVMAFIFTHSRRNYTSPATLRPETTLQPPVTPDRGPANVLAKSTQKYFSRFREWWAGKQSVATPEPVTVTAAVTEPQPDVKDYFGTIRDSSFDGLHWLKELSADKRAEIERDCRDVLDELNYPLIYPEEAQSKEKTMS